jgi:hypothetical protein
VNKNGALQTSNLTPLEVKQIQDRMMDFQLQQEVVHFKLKQIIQIRQMDCTGSLILILMEVYHFKFMQT